MRLHIRNEVVIEIFIDKLFKGLSACPRNRKIITRCALGPVLRPDPVLELGERSVLHIMPSTNIKPRRRMTLFMKLRHVLLMHGNAQISIDHLVRKGLGRSRKN